MDETRKREKLVLNLTEAAEAMGVSRPTMRLLSRVEGFPVLRIGNRVLFSKKGLERWISEMEGSRVELHDR